MNNFITTLKIFKPEVFEYFCQNQSLPIATEFGIFQANTKYVYEQHKQAIAVFVIQVGACYWDYM